VGYARRNFLVPIPRVASWEELNQRLLDACRERRARRLRGHQETIGERFERDRAAFLPLPTSEYEACEKRVARVSSMSLVRYRTNDYSVPTEAELAEAEGRAYETAEQLLKRVQTVYRDGSDKRDSKRQSKSKAAVN
jgi:hypothetical protein